MSDWPKIERVETYTLRVPLRRPISDALYHRTHWHIPVVEISTDDGLTGTGYSGVWAGDDLLCATIDRYLAPMLAGRDATAIGELWDQMYWSPLHWVARAGVAHMALGMVDTALWDLAARRAGLPLWRMLGGRHRRLETYNTDGGWLNFSLDELISDTCAMAEAGWKRVKLKVGGDNLASDLERVRRVQEALPAGVGIMVDANQAWDRVTARTAARGLADLGVGWLEEPLHPDDVAGHAELRSACPLPVALGENVYSLEAFTAFVRADAVDVVQVDVTRVAGVTEWLRIAHLAQANGLWVVPHAGDMMQVHQHLVAGVGAAKPAMVEYLPWGLEAFAEPVHVADGVLTLPDAPGASSAIAPEARRRWEARESEPR
ncbi:MAG: mandelate racemase/muconate lactonizing enzyme family protein [Nocardiopsaceae bacterium]|nr:mandelate racemase/muconate lactonizing enzyme family protein [Nocardiopsaceae bacterium]